MDQLLKLADRTESRDQVIPEIVKLGEGYSIVTEYTSFLVLENDGEYQRWKIDRRNALRIGRDRQAQQDVRARLDAIRNKALADIGPEPAPPSPLAASQPAAAPQSPVNATRPVNTPARTTTSPTQSADVGGGGSGPVGVLFVIAAGWLARRKHQQSLSA